MPDPTPEQIWDEPTPDPAAIWDEAPAAVVNDEDPLAGDGVAERFDRYSDFAPARTPATDADRVEIAQRTGHVGEDGPSKDDLFTPKGAMQRVGLAARDPSILSDERDASSEELHEVRDRTDALALAIPLAGRKGAEDWVKSLTKEQARAYVAEQKARQTRSDVAFSKAVAEDPQTGKPSPLAGPALLSRGIQSLIPGTDAAIPNTGAILESHGVVGEIAKTAADIGPALLPIGVASKIVGAPLAMAIYGATPGVVHGDTEAAIEGGVSGLAFGALAPPTAKFIRAQLARMPLVQQSATLQRLASGIAEAGAFAGVGQVVHPGSGIDQAFMDALVGSIFGVAAPGAMRAEVAKRAPEQPRPFATTRSETVAQGFRRQAAEALAGEVPEATEVQIRDFLEGRPEDIPPDLLTRMGVAVAPIQETAMKALGEAQKADSGAAPAGAVERFQVQQEAHQKGLRGEDATKAVEKALGETYDPAVVPPEPVPVAGEAPASGNLFPMEMKFGETEPFKPAPSELPWPEPQETPLFDAPVLEGPKPSIETTLESLRLADAEKEASIRRDAPAGSADRQVQEWRREKTMREVGAPTDADLELRKFMEMQDEPTTASPLRLLPREAPYQPKPDAPPGAWEGAHVYGGSKPEVEDIGRSFGPHAEARAAAAERSTTSLLTRRSRARTKEGPSLSQFVRRQGGLDYRTEKETGGLTGEMDRLRRKGSGSTGLVRIDGKGLPIERMMQSAKESGYPVGDMTPAEFLDAVELDATNRGQVLSEESTDLGAKALREEADHYAEMERRAIQEEAAAPGERVEFIGEDGDPSSGVLERETGRRRVIRTDDGRRVNVQKDAPIVRDPPAGEAFGLSRQGERGSVDPGLPAALTRPIWRPLRTFHRWVTQKTAPNITKANPAAGALAGSLAHTTDTSSLVAPEWASKVFGDAPPEARQRFTDAAVEFQLQTKRAEMEKRVADATDPLSRLTARAALDSVKTHFGDADFSFKTKAEWEAYWNGEEAAAFKARHRDLWRGKERLAEGMPAPEEMFAYMTERGYPTEDLVSTDPRDEMRLNMVALKDYEGQTTPAGERRIAEKKGEGIFGRRAAAENLRERSHPYAREFTGSGTEYLRDYPGLVENTYRRVLDVYTQAKMVDALEAGRDAVRVRGGTEAPETLRKEKAVDVGEIVPPRTILKDGKKVTVPATRLYVRESMAPEVKQLLRMHDPVDPLTPAQILNAAALFGLADNAWNLALDTMITTSAPFTGLRFKGAQYLGLVNNLWAAGRLIAGAARRPADWRARDLRLSNRGAYRSPRTPEWTAESFHEDLKANLGPGFFSGQNIPLKAFARLSTRVHEAGRRILSDAYRAMVKQGYAEDSPAAERDFVNRLGQYSGRAMGRFTQMARDSGLFPFNVAQRKGAAEVLRKVTFSAGTGKAGGDVRLRIGQMTKLLSVGLVIGLWNYWKTGDPEGRKGIPFGAMDLGTEDEHGNPRYSDLLGDLTGWRPAATATGTRAVLTARRRGLTPGQTADSAVASLVNSWFVKFMSSPSTGFAFRALTGRQPYYGSRSEVAPLPGEDAAPLQAAFAAKEAFQPMPVLLAATGLRKAEEPELSDAVSDMFPAFAPKTGLKDADAESLQDRIHFRQADDYVEYLVRRFRKMTPEQISAAITRARRSMSASEWKSHGPRLMRAAKRD